MQPRVAEASFVFVAALDGAIQLDGVVVATADINNHLAKLLVLDLDAESTHGGLGVVHTDSREGGGIIEPGLHANLATPATHSKRLVPAVAPELIAHVSRQSWSNANSNLISWSVC